VSHRPARESAARLIDLMLERGDLDGQRVWLRIKRSIIELQPPPTDTGALGARAILPHLRIIIRRNQEIAVRLPRERVDTVPAGATCKDFRPA
jgi:hypothetical protein